MVNKMKYITKFLLIIIITLVLLITLKKNESFRSLFYKHVYEKNISFASINEWYTSKFGSPIPFSDLVKTKPVFNETLKYSEANIYNDGVSLNVGSNYLIPNLNSGIVIFIGEKENYGKTIIIQQSNGIDVWYGNLEEVNVDLYDYVDKGILLGEVSDNLYMKFIKDDEVLDYQEHI